MPEEEKKKKKPKDYFKCVLHRCSYPPGTSHYLVHKGLGFLNVFNIQAIFSKGKIKVSSIKVSDS
jgi:hypothetical protein